MKRKSAEDKLIRKRQALVSRTALTFGIDEVTASELLRIKRRQGLRLNPLAGNPDVTRLTMAGLGWEGSKYDLMPNGYSITAGSEALRDSQLANDGAFMIQNAASWLPVLALDPQPHERILDVCAAPGGKTSHIAAMTGNQALITANDNSRSRLAKLQAMCRRMNADVERYTLFDATQLAKRFDGQTFDRILIDAPCSGEGLMNLDRDRDFASWSVAHIKRLQQLQKRILSQAWQLLEPGGTLVYSTCTMAPEENEAVISYGLRSLEGATIVPLKFDLPNRVPTVKQWNGKEFDSSTSDCLRLAPSSDIEAFFVCILTRSSGP